MKVTTERWILGRVFDNGMIQVDQETYEMGERVTSNTVEYPRKELKELLQSKKQEAANRPWYRFEIAGEDKVN